MTEEQQPVEQPIETPVETPVVAEEQQPHAETPAPATWRDELAKLDPKEFRKSLNQHDKLAGAWGYELQQARQAERVAVEAAAQKRAEEEAAAQLRELAKSDPVTFAEKWLTEEQQRTVQAQLNDLRGSTKQELASAIGRALNDVPEWQELGEEAYAKIREQLVKWNPQTERWEQKVSDDEVLPLYQRITTDLIASKRAEKIYAKWKAEELAKEREAIKQEIAAERLKTSDAPDVTRPKGPAVAVNIREMRDDEFDAWYKQRFGR